MTAEAQKLLRAAAEMEARGNDLLRVADELVARATDLKTSARRLRADAEALDDLADVRAIAGQRVRLKEVAA